jgi:hypothetical protein
MDGKRDFMAKEAWKSRSALGVNLIPTRGLSLVLFSPATNLSIESRLNPPLVGDAEVVFQAGRERALVEPVPGLPRVVLDAGDVLLVEQAGLDGVPLAGRDVGQGEPAIDGVVIGAPGIELGHGRVGEPVERVVVINVEAAEAEHRVAAE